MSYLYIQVDNLFISLFQRGPVCVSYLFIQVDFFLSLSLIMRGSVVVSHLLIFFLSLFKRR